MSEKTLVLGSGVSSLAYLFYNPFAFALAGTQVGGLFKQAADLGPQYVWVTDSTTKLIKDLGVSRETRSVRVGYLIGDELVDLDSLEPDTALILRNQYSMKTRGTPPKQSHMSDGRVEFEIYVIPVSELVEILLDRVRLRLITETATLVDIYEQRVLSGDPQDQLKSPRIRGYDQLVSTIPAPRFLKLIGQEDQVPKLLAWDKAYVKSNDYTVLEQALRSSGCDYAYLPGPESKAHRVKLVDSGGVVMEFTLRPEDRPMNPGPGIVIQKQGQIIGGHEILDSLPKSIWLLGRYASWKHGVRLEHVLEEIQ